MRRSIAKRITSAFLVICLLCTMLPAFAMAKNADDVSYAVTGGNIYFDAAAGTITDCDANVTAAEIPDTIDGVAVTSIGNSAFERCTRLTSIVLPDSVTSIGRYAFDDCTSLTSINIPDSVTSIGDYAFYNCTSLESIVLPDSVTSIGEYAFSNCTSLTSINIPDSVTSIGGDAFWYCTSLISIVLPDSVTSIGGSAFYNCTSLTSIVLSNSVTSIPAYAFYKCTSLTSINIPGSVTSIGKDAFAGCTSLASINIPNSVTSIGEYAFSNCTSLTSIVLSDSVTSIGEYAFYRCTSLTSIVLPDSVTSIGNNAFYYCTSLESIVLPDSVTSIGNAAFADCTSLESIVLPDSVTSIGKDAFSSCTSLESIVIPGSVTSIGYGTFWYCTSLESIVLPDSVTSIGDYAFIGCTSLTSIVLPDSVTSIGDHAFSNCTSLASIVIPGSVTSIDYYAFSNCTSLTSAGPIGGGYSYEFGWTESIPGNAFYECTSLASIVLPGSVTSIGDHAFSNCTSLESIVLPDSVTSIGYRAFEYCTSLTSAGPIGGGYSYEFGWTESIPANAFSNCTSLASIALPDSVTSIGEYAFYNCTSLASIVLPDSVTSIGEYAFYNCTSLTSIVLPDSVTSIGDHAFYNCTSLTSIDIPDSVTSIGYGAFYGCTSLESIVLPDSVTSIGDYAFYECTSLESIVLPDSVTSIGNDAFYNCTSLESIVLPDSVTSIGDGAFYDCTSLESIVLPDSVTSIGNYAFAYCTSLTSITIYSLQTTFGSYVFYGCSDDFVLLCFGGSDAEAYAISNNIAYQYIAYDGRLLSACVVDESGNAVTSGFAVTWTDSQGKASAGTTLYGADTEETYTCTVTLGDELAAWYQQPEPQRVGAGEDDATLTFTLEPISRLTLTGKVTDTEGKALSGVAVSAGSGLDGTTGADGSFRITGIPCGAVALSLRLDGYYSQTVSLDLSGEGSGSTYDAGTCALTKTIADRIALDITLTDAAKSGAMAISRTMSSAQTLHFTLTSGSGPITGFDVQGVNLIFEPDAVLANETVTLTASDPSGEYGSQTVRVKLDQSRMGSASVELVQKGSFTLGSLSKGDVTAMVFDSSGGLVKSSSVQPGWNSGVLDAGQYTLVLLEKNPLVQSVPKLSFLPELGLTEGTDYLSLSVSIANGLITEIADQTVPAFDGNKVSYTTSTSVTNSKPSGSVPGESVYIGASYVLDAAKNAKVSSLNIQLPDGVAPLSGMTALVNGRSAPYSYDTASNTVTVSGVAGQDSATVYVTCTAAKSGTYSASASLCLTNGGTAPLGSTTFQVADISLNVAERTAISESLTASGKAAPNSAVTLYDNGTEVGTATANAAGNWQMTFDLAKPVYSYSYHYLYATAVANGVTAATGQTTVTYDSQAVGQLEKITMYNTGDQGAQETVFDFTSASAAVPYYRMWPSKYPTFTFKAEFSGRAELLSKVYVVTTNSAGEKTWVELSYDAESGAWVGTHDYTSFADAPAKVSAAYQRSDAGAAEPFYSEEDMELLLSSAEELSEEIDSVLKPAYDESFSYDDIKVDQEAGTVSGTVSYQDPESAERTLLGTFKTECTPIAEDITAETLAEQGYEQISEEPLIYALVEEGASGTQVYVDLTNRIRMELTVNVSGAETLSLRTRANGVETVVNISKWSLLTLVGLGASMIAAGSVTIAAILNGVPAILISLAAAGAALLASVLVGLINGYFEASYFGNRAITQLGGHLDALSEELQYAFGLVWATCDDGTYRLSDMERTKYSNALNLIQTEMVQEYITQTYERIDQTKGLYMALPFVSSAAGSIQTFLSLPADLKNSDLIRIKAEDTLNYIDQQYTKIKRDISTICKNMIADFAQCEQDDPIPPDLYETPEKEMKYIADPSGYVYEAVPSNRLEGVTATIVYKDESGNEAVFDAEDYGQVNPQITGADGTYYWDVPQGSWKVKLEKEGYEAADTSAHANAANYSGWLPVPPPQLEISVPMVSTAAPAVQSVTAYTDRVEVLFSQYMDIESVKNALSLTVGGSAAEITITPLDAEYDGEEVNQYATRFAVTAAGNTELAGEVVLSVSSGAKNYGGKTLASGYTSGTLTPSTRPTALNVPTSVSTELHGTGSVTVTLEPAIAGQQLTVRSLSPGLVSVVTDTVRTGENGTATFHVTGHLPGSGMIEVTEPASGLSKIIPVYVASVGETVEQPENPSVTVAPVIATLADGTVLTTGETIPSGAQVTLSTTTAGASIRYTLDDTCPCTEDALTYTGPILITAATVLRAAAVLEGTYSTTIRLELKVSAASAYTITASAGIGGAISPEGAVTVGQGGSQSFTITAYSGYQISDVMVDGVSVGQVAGYAFHNVTANHTIAASFRYVGGYPISVASAAHGTVTASTSSAAEGTTVTLTVTPNDGYGLNGLVVTDAGGSQVVLTKVSDTAYTFTMPSGEVTVKPTFGKTTNPTPVVEHPFVDVPDNAYYSHAVLWAVEGGITTGTSATTFSPDIPCTRAQMVTLLWRAAGSPAVSGSNPFTDVPAGTYYYDAVLWAVSEGIANGTSANTFSPDLVVSRCQTVTFLYRYAGAPAVSASHPFADVSDGMYYTAAVWWAVAQAVTTGTSATTFSPDMECSRAQIVTFLYRALAE